MQPIFFAWTRSFWAFVVTAVLIIGELGEPVVRALATLGVSILGGDVEAITDIGMDLLPLASLIVLLHQRSGSARPYTMDPRAIR